MVTTKPLVQDTLSLLNMFGVNLSNPTIWNNLKCAVFLISFYVLFLQSLLNLLLNWKGVDSMYDLTVFMTMCQVMVKLNIVVFNRQKLCNMLGLMNQFWQVKASHAKIAAIYRRVRLGYKIGLFTTIFCITIYFGLAIMCRKIPMTMYYPTNPTPFYELILIYQIFIITNVTGYLGSEYLFFTCITYIVCEFKLIKERLLKLPHLFIERDEKRLLQELGSIIDQQNLVFELVDIFNEFYSPVILTLFFSSILIFSASLSSVVIKSSEDIEVLLVLVLFMSYFWVILLTYCVAGDAVISSSADVLSGILETNAWLIPNPRFNKALILVILRSQKLAKIKAGGVFDLNLETFTRVVNSAFSFFSLFKATYGKTVKN